MISLSFVVIALAAVSAGIPAVSGGPCCPTSRISRIPPKGIKPYIPPRPIVAEISVKNGQTFGTWKDPEFCPIGTLASGFDLKVEKSQGGGIYFGNDDTALNAIALKCKSPDILSYPHRYDHIKSGEGSWGKWKGLKECRNDGSTSNFLTAFQLRVEKKQGGKDDTAANNINFKCRSLTRSQNYVIAGAGKGWGSYGEWSANCPLGSAFCGLKTRVEGKQGFGDDTALNDVTFYCCEHPPEQPFRIPLGSVGEIGQRGEMGRRGESGSRGQA